MSKPSLDRCTGHILSPPPFEIIAEGSFRLGPTHVLFVFVLAEHSSSHLSSSRYIYITMVYSVSEDGFLSSAPGPAAPAPAEAPAGAPSASNPSDRQTHHHHMLKTSPVVVSKTRPRGSSAGNERLLLLSSSTPRSSKYSFADERSSAPVTPSLEHNRITVACRVKPREGGSVACASVSEDARTVAWAGERADGANARHFTFDYAAGECVGQEELFEKVKKP